MKINEGYKSAVNRYNSLTNSDDGRNFVSMLNHLGIPREHLLWAVERIEGEGINVHVFIQMYKEWKKYVFPYCEKQNIDIPNITQQTFQQMCTMIDTSKRYWAFPNVVYNHNGIIVCKLNTYMDAHMLPIETTWCITKIPRRFEEFCGEGKDGYYIVNNSAQEPYQRTLAIIMNGEVEYWDSNNKRMAELPDYIARFKEYEALLPKEVKEIFYSDAAKQGEQIEQQNNKTYKNESKNMNRKTTIRLTESELKKVITESVKNILKEEYDDEYDFQEELIGQIRNDLFSVLKKYDNHLLDSGVMAGWAYEYISYVHKILKQILPYNQWIKQNKN